MATKLYFRNTGSDYQTGHNNSKLNGFASLWANRIMSLTPGAAATATAATATVAGPTTGVEVLTGSVPLVWYTPPLDADVTIAGSITWNIWASESANQANVAINGVIDRVDATTGALTTIDTTARTTELGLTRTANNFSKTPAAGVACKRGDRLRFRIFGDDAGTMGATRTFNASIDGGVAGADGDTWVQLTENLTFAAEPAGTTVYPNLLITDIVDSFTNKELWTTDPLDIGGANSDQVTSVAGWHTGAQFKESLAGTASVWYTPSLRSFTLGGAVRVSLRGTTAAEINGAMRVELAVCNADGSSPVVWAVGTLNAPIIVTTLTTYTGLLSGDDVAVTMDQRIRLRVFADDNNSTGAQIAGQTVTLSVNNPLTFLTFSQSLAVWDSLTAPYDELIARDAPIAWWKLGEASGPFIDQMVGNNGAAAGGTIGREANGINAGANDGAISLGGGAYVSIPDSTDMDFTSPFSIEAWVNASLTDALGDAIWGKGVGAPFVWVTGSSNAPAGRVVLSKADVGDIVFSTSTAIADSNWHHVVVTYIHNSEAKIYIDGALASGTPTYNAFSANATAAAIGSKNGGSLDHPWHGQLDEVAIYNRALGPGEIFDHYTTGSRILELGFVDRTGFCFNPSLALIGFPQTLTLGLINRTAVASAPVIAVISGAQAVSVGQINRTAVTSAPTVAAPSGGPQAISIAQISQPAATFTPTLTAVTGFYVDSAAAGGGSGSFASPWNSYAQWSTAPVGSTIIFRGGATEGSPKIYNSGGTLTGSNFHLQNYPGEHVQFTDTSRATLLIFSLWTGGSIRVQGSGSMKFGPCQTAVTTDASWGNSYVLALVGCQGTPANPIVLDGGSNKKLIVASNSDMGIKVDSSGSTGSKFITIRRVEGTNNGSAIYLQNVSNPSRLPGPSGEGIIVEYCDLHDNNRMLDNRGVADVGAQGIGIARIWGTAAYPMEVRYCRMWSNYAASPQYGEDGIAFETYGVGYINIHHNVAWDCAGFFETGTDQNTPLTRFVNVHHNLLYGKSNGLIGTSGSTAILLRDFSDSTFDHNTIDLGPNGTPTHVLQLYDDQGTYGGSIDNVKIRNNIFNNRNNYTVLFTNLLPAAAMPVLDGNIYRTPDARTIVIDWNGTGGKTIPQMQALGYETLGQNGAVAWTDQANRDYTLASNSIALDHGVVISGVNDGYIGSAPDVGYDEGVGIEPPLFTTYVSDVFARTVANGWGIADTGGNYSGAGGTAADYAVSGGWGTMSAVASQNREQQLLSVSAMDVDLFLTAKLDKIPSAGGSVFPVVRRDATGANYYRLAVSLTGAGAILMQAERRTATVTTALGTAVTPAAKGTYTANDDFKIRFQVINEVIGTANIRAKIWDAAAAEPANWDIDTTDSTVGNQIDGAVSIFTFTNAITNGPILYSFDDLQVTSGEVDQIVGLPLLTNTPALYPVTLSGGTTIHVSDAFGRTLTDSWGAADTGGNYSASGGAAADYDVAGGWGTMAAIASTNREQRLLAVNLMDADFYLTVKLDKIPSAGGSFFPIVRRDATGAHYYRLAVSLTGAGGILIGPERRTAGVNTSIGSTVTPAAKGTYTANDDLRIRFQVVNLTAGVATFRAKLWDPASAEPGAWDISVTDSTVANQIAGAVSIFTFTNAISNPPVLYSFDDYLVTSVTTSSTLDISPGLIDRTAVASSPSISISVSLGLINRTATATAPSVATGAASVAPALINRTAVAHAPTIAQFVGQAVWTTPLDGVQMNLQPVLTFTIPESPAAMHFQIELDDNAGFSSPTVIDSSVSQTGWQYWNGSAWTAIPAGGVPTSSSGDEARHTVQSPLSTGTYYRRVRAGVTS